MNRYVLDTDTSIYWLNGDENIRNKAEQVGYSNLRITVITLAELKYGAYNSRKIKANLRNINKFLRKVKAFPLDHGAADGFGKLKADLVKKGESIGDFDILIAAITINYKGILVTNNTEHFKRIPGLCYENWMEV
ncbi:MAG: type II toxin-antitoxin system VapC family toxin [Bacteroidetes bacterium]|nr:type II toxin-antitoxin system VapC family toxin [Bacteroidota bacterium]